MRATYSLALAMFGLLWTTQCVVGAEGKPCHADTDCPGTLVCLNGVCFATNAEFKPTENSSPQEQPPISREVQEGETPPTDRSEPLSQEPSNDGQGKESISPETTKDSIPDNATDQHSESIAENTPDSETPGPKEKHALTNGGGSMSSSGYRLFGSVSAGLLGAPHIMSSPGYRLQAGFLSGTHP